MNEKMARQIAEAKKQTIGVEIEMNGITRSRAAKAAADFFGTGRYKDTAGRNGYCTWSAWDADGREWKFQLRANAGLSLWGCLRFFVAFHLWVRSPCSGVQWSKR